MVSGKPPQVSAAMTPAPSRAHNAQTARRALHSTSSRGAGPGGADLRPCCTFGAHSENKLCAHCTKINRMKIRKQTPSKVKKMYKQKFRKEEVQMLLPFRKPLNGEKKCKIHKTMLIQDLFVKNSYKINSKFIFFAIKTH